MTDRELLEAAAKAAGMETKWDQPRGSTHGVMRARYPGSGDAFPYWQPLDDDGAALRLAVALKLEIFQVNESRHGPERTEVARSLGSAFGHAAEPHDSDPYAATRRAIVRAAAAIGGAP